MLDTVGAEIHSITSQMTSTQWIVAAVLGLLLFVAIVKQLTKTALVVVLLVGIGYLIMHGQSANWSLNF